MSKNILLLEGVKNGYVFYKLACPDEALCDFFDDWSYQLSLKYSKNTVESYSRATAAFLDYILEVEVINKGLTPILLRDAISSYESFRIFGIESESSVASSAATHLQMKPLNGSSFQVHYAAINNFIEANENFRESLLLLESSGIKDSGKASNIAIYQTGSSAINFNVRKNIKQSSWFAGCIAGGAKKIKNKALSIKSIAPSVIYSSDEGGDQKTFPFDRAKELILSTSNLRDRCLWALIAATGCRISEALSILIDDIDLKSKKIRIIPPIERQSLLSKYLSERELNGVSHKGRISPETYPIRPFITIFWTALSNYMESMYKRGANHRFLFQKQNGEPYVNCYRSALESFQKASIEMTSTKYSFHSLRHMYGYYLKNWAPNSDGGNGFALNDVRIFMGHKDIETTRRYARDDVLKLNALVNYSNALQSQGLFTTVSDQKIKMLEKEIKRLTDLSNRSRDRKIGVDDDK